VIRRAAVLAACWLVVLLSMPAGEAMATAQQPDRLRFDGEEHDLLSDPLAQYLRRHPEIDLQGGDPQQDILCSNSGNHRGYVATFRIEGEQLFLDDILSPACGDVPARSLLSKLSGTGAPMPTDWFTGILAVPLGEPIAYVHAGYATRYARYRLFRIERGRVVATTTMDGDGYAAYRERQFEIHRASERYREDLASMLEDGDWKEEDAMRFIFQVDTDFSSDVMVDFPGVEPSAQ
jgi:hypothetical protein